VLCSAAVVLMQPSGVLFISSRMKLAVVLWASGVFQTGWHALPNEFTDLRFDSKTDICANALVCICAQWSTSKYVGAYQLNQMTFDDILLRVKYRSHTLMIMLSLFWNLQHYYYAKITSTLQLFASIAAKIGRKWNVG